MSESTWINGKTSGEILHNRAFLFGENPFTSMYARDGKIAFLSDHLDRLKRSQEWISPESNWVELREQLIGSLKNNLPGEGEFKVRITLFRNMEFQWNHLLAIANVPSECKPLKVCWAKSLRGVPALPHHIKMGSYFEADAEKRSAKAKGFDDIVFLNHRHQVLEGSTSNVFFRMKDKIVTPLAQNGMLSGITRNKLLELMQENSISATERLIEAKEIENVNEMWFTGSVSGLKKVVLFNDKEMDSDDFRFRELNSLYLEKRDRSLEEL